MGSRKPASPATTEAEPATDNTTRSAAMRSAMFELRECAPSGRIRRRVSTCATFIWRLETADDDEVDVSVAESLDELIELLRHGVSDRLVPSRASDRAPPGE
jgi:hypothetical protein